MSRLLPQSCRSSCITKKAESQNAPKKILTETTIQKETTIFPKADKTKTTKKTQIYHVGIDKVACQTNILGSGLFVTCKHPDLNLCFQVILNTLWHQILQPIFNRSGTQKLHLSVIFNI